MVVHIISAIQIPIAEYANISEIRSCLDDSAKKEVATSFSLAHKKSSYVLMAILLNNMDPPMQL